MWPFKLSGKHDAKGDGWQMETEFLNAVEGPAALGFDLYRDDCIPQYRNPEQPGQMQLDVLHLTRKCVAVNEGSLLRSSSRLWPATLAASTRNLTNGFSSRWFPRKGRDMKRTLLASSIGVVMLLAALGLASSEPQGQITESSATQSSPPACEEDPERPSPQWGYIRFVNKRDEAVRVSVKRVWESRRNQPPQLLDNSDFAGVSDGRCLAIRRDGEAIFVKLSTLPLINSKRLKEIKRWDECTNQSPCPFAIKFATGGIVDKDGKIIAITGRLQPSVRREVERRYVRAYLDYASELGPAQAISELTDYANIRPEVLLELVHAQEYFATCDAACKSNPDKEEVWEYLTQAPQQNLIKKQETRLNLSLANPTAIEIAQDPSKETNFGKILQLQGKRQIEDYFQDTDLGERASVDLQKALKEIQREM